MTTSKPPTFDSPASRDALELWLHDKVGAALDALKADRSRAISIEEVRNTLAAEHLRATLKK
jgi:antitoxin ParD1/3/4